MKKIIVLSDSHRNLTNMIKAVKIIRPDMIFHLGDHYQDAEKLHKKFPDIPMEAVMGNCDWGMDNLEKLVTVEGCRIFLCHGHMYGVKYDYGTLEDAARDMKADVVLFGHTHRSYSDYRGGLYIMNPGSIGYPRDPGGPTYGLLVIDGGRVFMSIMTLKS